MKFTTATIAAMVAQMAYAHTTITSVMLNGVDQGLPAPVHGIGTNLTANGYIRVPKNNDPVKDVTSPTLTCNVNNTAAPVSIPVAAGDKLTLQWHHDFITDSDDIIDGSHKGPVITYMAPAAGNGAGDVWVKIQEQGYDTTTKTWAVDTLKTNKGKVDVMVPGTLASGDYLVRQEIIALHEADTAFSDNPKRGAQLYPGCVQITVANGGSTALPAGVAIPGAYKAADVVFNLNGGKPESFKIPGPAVWAGAKVTNTTAKATRQYSSAKFNRAYLGRD